MQLVLRITLGQTVQTPCDIIEAITASIGQYQTNSDRLFVPLIAGDRSDIHDPDRNLIGRWQIENAQAPDEPTQVSAF